MEFSFNAHLLQFIKYFNTDEESCFVVEFECIQSFSFSATCFSRHLDCKECNFSLVVPCWWLNHQNIKFHVPTYPYTVNGFWIAFWVVVQSIGWMAVQFLYAMYRLEDETKMKYSNFTGANLRARAIILQCKIVRNMSCQLIYYWL